MGSEEPTEHGEEDAVELVQSLFVRYLPVVRASILARIPNPHWADDVVQETFLIVRRKAKDFRPGTNYVSWVCQIARFKTQEALRSNRKKFEPISDKAMSALLAAEPQRSDSAERLRLFEECLDRLAPKARQVMELRYRGEQLPEEIAMRIGWTLGAVRVAISRARALLQECVAKKLEAR